MPRVFHLVNGILNFPGHSTNWNGRGVTWIHVLTPAKAEKIEYFCGPVGRAFGQKERARKLFQTMRLYDDSPSGPWENIVAGHSNGADVIITMLRDYFDWPDIDHLHLVCAACEANFNKNGLNHYLRSGRVKRVTVYVAGKDLALRLAHTLPAKILGYGVLGLHGPRHVAPDVGHQVRVVKRAPWDNYGHSTCWRDDCFEETMKALTGGVA